MKFLKQKIQKVLKVDHIYTNINLFAPISQAVPFIINVNDCGLCAKHEHKSIWEKTRLSNTCIVPVDYVSNGVSGIFLTHFPDFMKEMEWLKRLKHKM